MKKDIVLYSALFFLVFGIFTSVTILGLFHILAAIPLIIYCWQRKSDFIKLPKSAYALLLFCIVGFISNLFNISTLVEPVRAFGNQKYALVAIMCLMTFPYFFKSYLTRERFLFLLRIFCFTILAAMIYGIFEARFGFDIFQWEAVKTNGRSAGFTGIMRYGYGSSLALTFLLGLAVLCWDKKSIQPVRKCLVVGIVAAFIGMIESKCRGAILGFACALPFIIYLKDKVWGAFFFFGISAGIVLSAIVIMNGGSQDNRIFQKIGSPSNLIRLSQYHSSLLAFQSKPLLGHGVNQFQYIVKSIKEKNNIFWPDYCEKLGLECDFTERYPYYNQHAHNIFLEKLADLGLVGFLVFVLWLLFWFIEMLEKRDIIAYITIPFIINMFVSGQFEYIFDANNSFLIFLVYSLSSLKKEQLKFEF